MTTLNAGLRSVPWIVGTAARAAVRSVPRRDATLIERKIAEIMATIDWIQKLVPGKADKRREALEAVIEGQRRRLAWLKQWGRAPEAKRRSRRDAIVSELGSEVRFAGEGLPPKRSRDQRFVDLLMELAILDLCARAPHEVQDADL